MPGLSPEEFDEKYKTKTIRISPIEFEKKHGIKKGITPEEFGKRHIPQYEEQSFIAKHPTLYGAFGIAQELIPYLKYVDPSERKKFAELSTKKQTRELLLENFELLSYVGAPRIVKGVGQIGKHYFAKFLPKTFEKVSKAYQYTPWKGKPTIVKPKVVAEKVGKEMTDAAAQSAEKYLPAISKIGTAIKEAAPLRKKQATLYSIERGKRIGKAMAVKVKGEKGFIIQKGKLKGELPKVEYESIRTKVTQQDINDLFNLVKESPVVKGWDNITAQEGLARLVGAQGGALPTDSQLAMLRKIFPPDFIKTILKKRSTWQKVKKGAAEALNIPRAVMSSYDLSAPFRQGLFLVSHPKRFFGSFKRMFKLFGSEKTFTALQESITQKPTYELMRKSGLALTELGEQLGLREEIFMSNWAEKIPLAGRGIRASGRAYVGFLNKLRADVFDDLIKKADKLGLNASQNIDLSTEIARFVNAASGRASLAGLERSAVALNAVFFSPRLIASRLTLLNPGYYITASPFVRKEALKSLFVVTGAATTALGLAKFAGADVGLDPRSADFLKIKVGNTRIDILGGVQQYMRAAGQIISGEYISSTTGKLVTLGEGYRPLTRYEIATRFLESKYAPPLSFAKAMLGPKKVGDKEVKVSEEVAKRFVPMVMQDIYDIAKEDPELLPLAGLGVFGVGLQTYGPRRKKSKSGYQGIGGIRGISGF